MSNGWMGSEVAGRTVHDARKDCRPGHPRPDRRTRGRVAIVFWMPPAPIVIAGAIALLAILLFGVMLAQWLKTQAMAAAIVPKGPCGFSPPA